MKLIANRLVTWFGTIRALYRGRVSQKWMGRGSAISKKKRLQIVPQFQNNAFSTETGKPLNIPSSAVHNIKRLIESGVTSVHKGRGWKSVLDHDLQALRGTALHCVHYTGMIMSWKSLSFSKNMHTVYSRLKRIGNHLACYQRLIKKPASLMVWGCISAYWTDNLHIWRFSPVFLCPFCL